MRFTVPADHPSLPGHFPGRPLVPGVLLLDHVLAAIEAQDPALGALGPLRLPQVKFLQPLLPGEEARVEVEPAGEPGAGPRWRFRVWREDVLLASGEMVIDSDGKHAREVAVADAGLASAGPAAGAAP